MAHYSALIGKRVEAHYRAGVIEFRAHGSLVAETSTAVVLEERFSHNGREKTIRFEIPYDYLLCILECGQESGADVRSAAYAATTTH